MKMNKKIEELKEKLNEVVEGVKEVLKELNDTSEYTQEGGEEPHDPYGGFVDHDSK